MFFIAFIFVVYGYPINETNVNGTSCKLRQKAILLKEQHRAKIVKLPTSVAHLPMTTISPFVLKKKHYTEVVTPSMTTDTSLSTEVTPMHNNCKDVKCKSNGYTIALTTILTALFAIFVGLLLVCICKICVHRQCCQYVYP